MKAYSFDQIPLVTAITKELSRQQPNLPADHRMNAVIKAANNIIAEYARQPVMMTPGMGLLAWLDSDDTGTSSVYMAYALCEACGIGWPINIQPEHAYPRDPDDLGRCFRLIDAVPEFGGLLPEVAHRGAHWMAVTSNWADWLEMYQAGDTDRLHTEMQDAFAKAGAQ
jgi:hypothetical protein